MFPDYELEKDNLETMIIDYSLTCWILEVKTWINIILSLGLEETDIPSLIELFDNLKNVLRSDFEPEVCKGTVERLKNKIKELYNMLDENTRLLIQLQFSEIIL